MNTKGVIRPPGEFRGIFSTACARYEPLLLEARDRLRAIEIPDELRERYDFAVLAHDQPSFVLLSVLYLDLAERTGGIKNKHRAYLPWLMLNCELVAVIDDAIDRAKCRSDRQTFIDRHGMAQLLPFSHFLMAVMMDGAAATIPEAVPWLARSFAQLCSLETLEVATRFPSPSIPAFERALEYHYGQATGAVECTLRAATTLNGCSPLPDVLVTLMGILMQDVDDIVNFAEDREAAGENDDLRLGTVTFPLLATLRAEQSFAETLDAFWSLYRRASTDRDLALERCDEQLQDERRLVRRAIARSGVPATLAKIKSDLASCVAAAPAEFRDFTHDVCEAFVGRIRHFSIDALREPSVAWSASPTLRVETQIAVPDDRGR